MNQEYTVSKFFKILRNISIRTIIETLQMAIKRFENMLIKLQKKTF